MRRDPPVTPPHGAEDSPIAPGNDAHAAALDAFLADVRRRLRLREVAHAAIVGAGLLLASIVIAWLAGATRPREGASASTSASVMPIAIGLVLACLAIGSRLALRAATWREPALLPLIEARQPAFRNLLVTARELLRHPDRAIRAIRTRVLHDAAAVARETSAEAIIPPRDTHRAIGITLALLLGTAIAWHAAARWPLHHLTTRTTGASTSAAGSPRRAASATTAIGSIRSITAVVTPPAYTGLPAITLRDPSRIDAIAGSRLLLRIDTPSSVPVRAAFNDRAQVLTPAAPHELRGELVLTEAGVLSIAALAPLAPLAPTASSAPTAAPATQTTTTTTPRLIAVTVVPDQPPVVDILEPGRDLLFGDTTPRIRIVARAQDDLGLRGLSLRYTKVSGSGEQYEFHEGELPLSLARTDGRQWQGRVERSLRDLALSEGDLFVYYAAATDARPDAGRAVSDSYVIEIGKPSVAIAGGFAIPPDEDRFAISLNALIQKTERLHARRATMPDAAFNDAALALAVEQRMVRTEFLFTMGFHGHVQDEEVEAEHSHEIQEGRLENRGQAEMAIATRLMTWAEQQLTAADTAEALKAQRGALAAVQRALSRHRYFLRTMPTRGEIDLSRRLTGDLSAAASARWPAATPPADARRDRIRTLLADVGRLATGLRVLDGEPANRETLAALAASVANRVLALDPASLPLQQAAADLTRVSQQIAAGRANESLGLVRGAANTLLSIAGTPAPARTPRGEESAEPGLRGARVDALRERGGRR